MRSMPGRDAAVRRRAVAQRPQQEAEALLGLLGREADRRRARAAAVRAVDPDRARTPSRRRSARSRRPRTRPRPDRSRPSASCSRIGRGERMVLGLPAAIVLVPLEEREVDHEEEPPGARRPIRLEAPRQMRPQAPEHALDDRARVGRDERDRAGPAPGGLADRVDLLGPAGTSRSASAPRPRLSKIRYASPFPPHSLANSASVVEVLARERIRGAGHAQRAHARRRPATAPREDAEPGLAHGVGDVRRSRARSAGRACREP